MDWFGYIVQNIKSLINLTQFYQATINDASIFLEELEKDAKLKHFVSSFHGNWGGKVKFMLDRGYR